MFSLVTLRGGEAAVLYGYRTAAVARTWRITKQKGGHWALTCELTRADHFSLRQRPLIFAAPRKGGYWCFPVLTVAATDRALTATLGQPEY